MRSKWQAIFRTFRTVTLRTSKVVFIPWFQVLFIILIKYSSNKIKSGRNRLYFDLVLLLLAHIDKKRYPVVLF